MTTEQRKAVRQVVILLIASITASVGFALLTLLFRHDVLAYQQSRDPSADPSALSATLWTRPIPILLVAAFYTAVIRKFRAGSPRAHRRIRIVSAIGFAAVAWLLFSSAYPAWLRPIQAVQLALLATLIVAVNRPVVRAAFPPITDTRPRNRRAALTLAVLAPAIAEVSLGTVSLHQAWVMPLYVPIYGAGALFIRETVRRTGGGLPSLLLLGVAYGLAEEGLALQSLTSPHLYGAADWSPRMFGFNTAYTELNLPYHALFSVTIPILLVELLFRSHGRAPYLRRGGLITTGVLALLGAALLRISVPPVEDPGYQMPLPAILVVLAAIAAVTATGLRLRPQGRATAELTHRDAAHPAAAPSGHPAHPSPAPIGHPAHPTPTPSGHPSAPPSGHPAQLAALSEAHAAEPSAGGPVRPLAVAGTTAVATFGFLGFIWPFGSATQPMFTHGAWALVPMAVAAAIVVATWRVLRRWTSSPAWTPAHTVAAYFGALVAHTSFGLIANAETLPDRLFLLAIALVTAAAGSYLARRPTPAPSLPPVPKACSDVPTPV